MSDTTGGLSNTSALIYGSLIAIVCILVGVRTRKKKVVSIEQSSEKSYLLRTTSWLSVGTQKDLNRTNSGDFKSCSQELLKHPDGPNMGYESNHTWIGPSSINASNSSVLKSDLYGASHMNGKKMVVVMVGLPGRGKTYIARKIARYLRWIGYRTRVFSLAKYRLDKMGTKTADFFDPTNTASYNQRIKLTMDALDDALRYLSRGSDISILDGTNTTQDRRDMIRAKIASEDMCELLWIESLGEGIDGLSERQEEELKDSPDFLDRDDYEKRLHFYQGHYQTLQDNEGSFIKVDRYGSDITLHEIHGFLRSKIVSFVMNLHTEPRPIYMTRHGESTFNVQSLIGGDSSLTSRGSKFAKALATYMKEAVSSDEMDELCVWTSNMKRSVETASEIKCKHLVEWRALREIEVGICDGLSYNQIKELYSEEYRARHQDKLRYRYPRGESYLDVITRLEPVIFEIERRKGPLIVVAHQAVLRCLYAYFLDLPNEEIPYLSIPLHTLIKLNPKACNCIEKRIRLEVHES